MVRRKKDKGLLFLGFAVITIFGLYLLLSVGNVKFKATHYDAEGNEILGGGQLKEAIGVEQAQSLFSLDKEDVPFYLQSTVPVTEEGTIAILQVVIDNSQSQVISVRGVTVTKNDEPLYSDAWTHIILGQGKSYIYETKPIDLKGEDAQVNKVTFDFTIQPEGGNSFVQRYEYQYFSLTPCTGDAQCSFPTPLCDVSNMAGFSNSAERYCTKPCTDNSQCYPGQVCKLGYCGYS